MDIGNRLLDFMAGKRCLAALFVLAGALPCSGQNAEIMGTVADISNQPVSGALVRVINQATGVERKTATGSDGSYQVPFLLPGSYQVFIQAPGFSTASSRNIVLDAGHAIAYNVRLRVGSITENIIVNSTPALLQREDASVGQVLSSDAIDRTPLSGRNWVYLAQLAPGVVPAVGSRGSGKGDFNANGQRSEENDFLLDGMDNNTVVVDFLNGSSFVVRPPPDALSEFTIQTANYSAEFGRSAGAVVNAVMKSGSNAFHGDAWEYFRNDKLDARDWEATGVPGYRENQFGGAVGLPLVKNRVFLFGDIEANRIFFQETNYLTVPTPLMRQGDFTELLNGVFNGTGKPIQLYEPGNPSAALGSSCGNPVNVMCPGSVDAIARELLGMYPAANVNTGGAFVNNYIVNRDSKDNTFQFDLRADWNPTSGNQLFARLSLLNEGGNRPPPLGPNLDGGNSLIYGDDGTINNSGRNLAVNYVHVFSEKFANEVRAGYTWGDFAFTQANAYNPGLAASLGMGGIPAGIQNGGLPAVNIGGISSFGSPEFYPAAESQRVLQLLYDLSTNVGPHFLKFGATAQRIRFSTRQPSAPRGEYDYDSSAALCTDSISYTGYGVSDFLANSMGCAELSTTGESDDLRWDREAYIQDDWKFSPRLTLNLGIRYQYPQTYQEVHGRQAEWVLTSAAFPGNASSLFRVPSQSAKLLQNSAVSRLLASSNVTVQYSSNPYLVDEPKTDFAPRLGLSYLLMNRLILRAGFGIFFGGLENVGYSGNLGNNPPFINQSTYVSPAGNGCVQNACPTDGITLEQGFGNPGSSGAVSAPGLRGIDAGGQTPYTSDYNLTLEYGIRENLAAVLAFVGSQGRRLVVFTNPNAPLALQRSGANQNTEQPLPAFGAATFSSNTGRSVYNSLQATLERRAGSRMNFLATYTLAHALDDAPTPLGSNGDDGYPNTNIQPLAAQYSNSPFDVRHRLTLNASVNLEWPAGARHWGLAERVLDHWSADLAVAVQTGNPFSITPDLSTFRMASGARIVYANRVGDPFHAGGTAPASNPGIVCPSTVRNHTHWYNPCAYGNPTWGTAIPPGVAVSGEAAEAFLGGRRNDLYGPGYKRANLSVFKEIALTNPVHMEVRTDIFNLFNTPSFANPNSNYAGGGLQSGVATNSSAGGQITAPRFFQDFTPDARFFQISIKFKF